MPLIRTSSAAPSRRPYAIDRDSFRKVEDQAYPRFEIDAIWLGRKNGATTISMGTLGLWWHNRPANPSLDECIAKCDSRYGGDPFAVWNGTHLWVDPRRPMTLRDQGSWAQLLDEILSQVPVVPTGWDGWYLLR